jgi:ribosomal-protein-alanine N-acetyltransferase
MSFHVRGLTAQDIDAVLTLSGRPVEAPHWSRSDYERLVTVALEGSLIRCSLVAQCAGSVVGFAVASWLPQEAAAEVESLVVDENYRRQGIGSALIEACVAWAAGGGATSIRLEVRASNAAALALYHRHGFRTVGARRAYYSAPVEDAVLLSAPLDS